MNVSLQAAKIIFNLVKPNTQEISKNLFFHLVLAGSLAQRSVK